jgi:hypothetical protein
VGRAVLILVALWIALAAAGAGVGFAVLRALPASPRGRAPDRLFFAWWVGTAALAWAAFALVPAVSLHGAAPWFVLAAAIIALYGLYRSREVLASVRMRAWVALAAVAVLVAERSVATGNLEDTGGYHWSLIQWYGEYGIAPGLGLFQWRLATHSSWLALTALLDVGALESRVATVANGVLFVGCLWFFVVCAIRWIRGCASLADRFALIALGFLLQLIAKWEMRASPSPDIPVLLAIVVVCWKALVDGEKESATSGDAFALALLAVVTVTFKLNALPLAVVCAVCFLLRDHAIPRARWKGVALLALVAAPLVVASWVSTGCPLFPSPWGCLEGPAAIGVAAARQYSAIIGATARHDIGQGLVLSACALAYLAWMRDKVTRYALRAPVAIALTGIAFTAFVAPTTRFAAGYLTILPALAFAQLTAAGGTTSAIATRAHAALASVVVAALAVALALPLYKEFIYPSLRQRHFDSWAERKRGDPAINAANPDWWLMPNRIDYRESFDPARAADFDYAVSPRMTCWNHPQPCASNATLSALPRVRLRDPERGLAGGFVRAR